MSFRLRRIFCGKVPSGFAVIGVVQYQSPMNVGLVWRTVFEVFWPARASPEDVSRN